MQVITLVVAIQLTAVKYFLGFTGAEVKHAAFCLLPRCRYGADLPDYTVSLHASLTKVPVLGSTFDCFRFLVFLIITKTLAMFSGILTIAPARVKLVINNIQSICREEPCTLGREKECLHQ